MHFFDDSLLPENQEKLAFKLRRTDQNGCQATAMTFH